MYVAHRIDLLGYRREGLLFCSNVWVPLGGLWERLCALTVLLDGTVCCWLRLLTSFLLHCTQPFEHNYYFCLNVMYTILSWHFLSAYFQLLYSCKETFRINVCLGLFFGIASVVYGNCANTTHAYMMEWSLAVKNCQLIYFHDLCASSSNLLSGQGPLFYGFPMTLECYRVTEVIAICVLFCT